MNGNSILNKAKYSDNTDEWYTDYKTVEDEVSHYVDQFKNKIVLCNCDDPYKSAFANYFIKIFIIERRNPFFFIKNKMVYVIINMRIILWQIKEQLLKHCLMKYVIA